MKTGIRNFLVILLMSLAATVMSASYIDFYVAHNTGTSVDVNITTPIEDAGTDWGNGEAVAPGSYLYAYANWGGGYWADAHAVVDSTYATGRYYIGYYYGGADCYLTIY